MEPENINNTLLCDNRVISSYAEIYLHENYNLSEECNVVAKENETLKENVVLEKQWISPSDLLTDVVQLHPPFTSKITRGITHEGIVNIGNGVINKELTVFLKSLNKLLEDNDSSWNYILTQEKREVIKKVKSIYKNIFDYKSNIMKNEIALFYEKTLQDLEIHLKKEVNAMLLSVQANIISDSNRQIQYKLQEERKKLEKILHKKYISEIAKVKKYYLLLLHNELYRNNKLVNKTIHERNFALNAFYKQIEADRITSTMYVMSLERKKCRIQKIQLDNLHTFEILEKIKYIKENTNAIEDFKHHYVTFSDINKKWEQNIKNILKLFLKFISFSLKLIPEQSSFLLCMEKMVVLQLKEIQRNPHITKSILLNDESESNIFKFKQPAQDSSICDKEHFVLIGDLSDPVPKKYGSRESLPSDVDLPHLRIGRQYVYAKCHGYQHIKDVLESQKCKCRIMQPASQEEKSDTILTQKPTTSSVQDESSLESLLLDDIEGIHDCPVRKCSKWIDKYSFPDLMSYIDYTEENYKRVTAILDSASHKQAPPSLIDPKSIAYAELPFSATKEPFHTVETQYSSQEGLSLKLVCPCFDKVEEYFQFDSKLNQNSLQELQNILQKRRRSLKQLITEKPHLLKIFTDESFDDIM